MSVDNNRRTSKKYIGSTFYLTVRIEARKIHLMSTKINLKNKYAVHTAKILNMVIPYIRQQFRNISVNESYQNNNENYFK